ncbi:hypothetical protein MHU86_8057 [Fragilaria crotonensis]|nr:hypothetical protein MHU86_8057 [Fragilaria crotonensis]
MADEATPQQLEEWVSQGDYHAALQALGRPRFEPGDGSWSEWIMREMHRAHYERPADLKIKPVEYKDVDRFLRKVALNTISKEDHERCWLCYTHLCHLNGEPAHPVVYHAVFFDASPMELAMTLAQRGDDEGLEIMLYYFGHMLPKLHLVDHFPAILPAYQYARFILDDPTVDDDWFLQHLQKRYECAGRVYDWIDLLEQHRPDSLLLERLRRLTDTEESQYTEFEKSLVSNGKFNDVVVSTDETVQPEVTDAQQIQATLLARLDSSQSLSAFTPVVTPDRDQVVGTPSVTMARQHEENGGPNLIDDSPPIKPEYYSAVPREYVADQHDVSFEGNGGTPRQNADDNHQQRQGPTRIHHLVVTSEPEPAVNKVDKHQEKQIGVDVVDFRDHRDDSQLSAALDDAPVLRQATQSMEVGTSYTSSTAIEESATDERSEKLYDVVPNPEADISLSASISKAIEDEATLKLRRDLSDCIKIVKTLVDNMQSQEVMGQHDVLSGLQDLRKRLKGMRKVRCVPEPPKLGDLSRDTLDESESDQGTIVALRRRVADLENAVCQYQSREATLCIRDDQAGQDTHESNSVDLAGNQDFIVESLKEQLAKVKNEFEMEKRADTARIRYLRQRLMENEQLSAASPSASGQSPLHCSRTLMNGSTPRRQHRSPRIPDSSSTETQLQDLAYALELSEQQRAQALEDLQQEREFYAAKVRSLQLAFRDMMGTT